MKTPDGRCIPDIFGPGPVLSDGTPLKTLSGTGTRRTFEMPDGEVFNAPATCNPYALDMAATTGGPMRGYASIVVAASGTSRKRR